MTGLDLTLKSQTPLLVVATWQPPDGCIGYAFYVDGRRVSNSMNPAQASVSFRKPDGRDHVYEVQALGELASGALEIPNPKPPARTVVAVYDNDQNKAADWPAIAAVGGTHLICGADDPDSLAELERTGGKAWATVGYWDDNLGAFSHNDADALTIAEHAVANYPGVIEGWYVADEPSMTHPTAPHSVAMRSNLLSNVLPVETIVAMWDTSIFGSFKASCSAFAIDGYPNRDNWNMNDITSRAAAADLLGIRYYGVLGAFTDGGVYKLPTAAQLQQMADTWKATKEVGRAIYEWGPAGGPSSTWLQNRPELLKVLRGLTGLSSGDVLATLAFGEGS